MTEFATEARKTDIPDAPENRGLVPPYRPPVAHAADRLSGGQQLTVNDRLTAPNGRTQLVLQADGNLVLYRTDTGQALWASNTSARPVTRAVLQTDGNLCCYDAGGHVLWATGTAGHPGAWLVLQDDGNVVLYDATNRPLWASNTVHDWSPLSGATENQHVGAGEWMNSTASTAASGLITGRTRIWCTKDLAGFHGSVFPVLLDGDGHAIWPADPQSVKHQYGVDGSMIFGATSDRTVSWTAQADPAVLPQARGLALIQFVDPRNMLLTDLHIIGEAVKEIAAAVKAITG